MNVGASALSTVAGRVLSTLCSCTKATVRKEPLYTCSTGFCLSLASPYQLSSDLHSSQVSPFPGLFARRTKTLQVEKVVVFVAQHSSSEFTDTADAPASLFYVRRVCREDGAEACYHMIEVNASGLRGK